jgi:hypothetical protein
MANGFRSVYEVQLEGIGKITVDLNREVVLKPQGKARKLREFCALHFRSGHLFPLGVLEFPKMGRQIVPLFEYFFSNISVQQEVIEQQKAKKPLSICDPYFKEKAFRIHFLFLRQNEASFTPFFDSPSDSISELQNLFLISCMVPEKYKEPYLGFILKSRLRLSKMLFERYCSNASKSQKDEMVKIAHEIDYWQALTMREFPDKAAPFADYALWQLYCGSDISKIEATLKRAIALDKNDPLVQEAQEKFLKIQGEKK